MDELTQHKKRMLKFLKTRQKYVDIPPLPPETYIKPYVFDIETATKPELEKEFMRKRIKHTEARTVAVEMDLARIRSELIEKEHATKQLQFLLIALRQRLLAIPLSYARQLLHKTEVREVHSILQKAIHEALHDVKDLPLKVTDPNWLETLNDEMK